MKEELCAAGLDFTQGPPKICVPLTAPDLPGLLAGLDQAQALPAHVLEWRMDCFAGDAAAVLPRLAQRARLPLLCTLRTQGEGGRARLDPAEYESALERLLDQGGFQLIDVELACGGERAARLVKKARERGVLTVVSKHDFERTPPVPQMVDALAAMKALGADLPKLAVMPQGPLDVLALMEASVRARERLGPVITMSMGTLGAVSRLAGELTGSCLTFGAGANASAPGQLPAAKLWEALTLLHQEKGEVRREE